MFFLTEEEGCTSHERGGIPSKVFVNARTLLTSGALTSVLVISVLVRCREDSETVTCEVRDGEELRMHVEGFPKADQ